MNDKQLELIAQSIALASGLHPNGRFKLKNYIIDTYHKLEENEEVNE